MQRNKVSSVDHDHDSSSVTRMKNISIRDDCLSDEKGEARSNDPQSSVAQESFLVMEKSPFTYPHNSSLEVKKQLIKRRLMSEHVLWTIKRKLKGEVMKIKYDLNEVTTNSMLLPQIMQKNNWQTQLQNEIFKLDREALDVQNDSIVMHHVPEQIQRVASTPGEDSSTIPYYLSVSKIEPLDCVQNARCAWAKFVKDQTLSISNQLKVPLCSPNEEKKKSSKGQRSSSKKKASSEQNDTDSNPISDDAIEDNDIDDDKPRYTGVYSCSKLFNTCIHIQSSNHSRSLHTTATWGLIKLELKTLTKPELQDMFSKLNPEIRHYGVDDENNDWFSDDCLNCCRKIVQSNYIPSFYLAAQTGLPASIRPKIWSVLLNASSCESDKQYFQTLLLDVSKRKFMVDEMVHNDVKRTSDDENYFIFEEVIDSIMIAFSRDARVYDMCTIKPVSLMTMTNSSNITSIPYPPSGIIPFEGISLMASPFAYLFSRIEDVYFAFRSFYCRYLCKLHTISSKHESLIHLCKTFEDLLQNHDPQLFYHLLHLKIHPLEIAFNWIYHGFAGYLTVDQLLLLWDRIIGFDNLYLLPILSVAIFSFRSKFLMRVEAKQEIYDVFSDFTVVKVVPLLQVFLFT